MFGATAVAADTGQAATTALNAANELAVAAFLDNKLGFTQIHTLCARVVEQLSSRSARDLDTILELDSEARRLALRYLQEF